MQTSTVAAHRFGLGEADLTALRGDPRSWVLEQFRPSAMAALASRPGSADLRPSEAAFALGRRILTATLGVQNQSLAAPARRGNSAVESLAAAAQPTAGQPGGGLDLLAPGPDRDALRQEGLKAVQWRWQHAVTTDAPVLQRWAEFWSNHFCVAATKGAMLGMVWPFEREAIQPRVGGRFVDLLMAATTHPSMLLYLDNAQSMGPNATASLRSARDGRRARGLNENHARELLELHTLGVNGGYTQADVTELARLMTGWTVRREPGSAVSGEQSGALRDNGDPSTWPSHFVANWHEPGSKRVLGQTYAEGPDALRQMLGDLARHPATAQHLATKLVRHFVADEPPPALVSAVAERWRSSEGNLAAVASTLFSHPMAWGATSSKFKTPQDLLISAHRVLRQPVHQPERWVALLTQMGQPPGRAPSPQGWPDRAEDWLAPDALWKRIEWAHGFASTLKSDLDVMARAEASFGVDLAATTRRQIERADSAGQALALFLASAEFQRR